MPPSPKPPGRLHDGTTHEYLRRVWRAIRPHTLVAGLLLGCVPPQGMAEEKAGGVKGMSEEPSTAGMIFWTAVFVFAGFCYLTMADDCEKRGGVLVETFLNYKCVSELPK